MQHPYSVTREMAKPEAEMSSFGNSYLSPTSSGGSVAFVWDDHAQSLGKILNEKRLPQVVHISEEDVVQCNAESEFNFQQPLLLYKELTLMRVYTRNILREQIRGQGMKFREVGPYVVIPQDYPGLFKHAGNNGQANITTIANIARIMPASFFSTGKLKGYVSMATRKDTIIYEKKDIPPSLYHVLEINEDLVTYVNSRKSEKRKLMLTLHCVIEDGAKQALLPYDTTGTFYVVDMKKKNPKEDANRSSCLFRVSEIIPMLEKDKDSKMELVWGDPPNQDCQFTGILRFSHVVKEHVILACTLNAKGPRPFELSISRGPLFKVALNTADHQSEQAVKTCAEFMKSAHEKFMREMKVRRDFGIEKKELREQGCLY